MDLKCEFPECGKIFYWSGIGRISHYCIPHRKQINRQKANAWHKTHYRKNALQATTSPNNPIDPESIIRPLVSHKFSGPGLFEPLPDLFNHAITVKARTLNLPKDYVRNFWIFGQAGQQFMRSFLHPDR